MTAKILQQKTRPILFNTSMVQAILQNRKTQTRRPIKPLCGVPTFYSYQSEQPYPYYFRRKDAVWDSFKTMEELAAKYCPYGSAGDLLWVRETWSPKGDLSQCVDSSDVTYRASISDDFKDGLTTWKPSIFMPRWASRLTLKITKIEIEKLNQISNEDAIAEGLDSVEHYCDLWDLINKKKYPWNSNPFVWKISFASN